MRPEMVGHGHAAIWAVRPNLGTTGQVRLRSTIGGGVDAGIHLGSSVIQGGVEEVASDGELAANGAVVKS